MLLTLSFLLTLLRIFLFYFLFCFLLLWTPPPRIHSLMIIVLPRQLRSSSTPRFSSALCHPSRKHHNSHNVRCSGSVSRRRRLCLSATFQAEAPYTCPQFTKIWIVLSPLVKVPLSSNTAPCPSELFCLVLLVTTVHTQTHTKTHKHTHTHTHHTHTHHTTLPPSLPLLPCLPPPTRPDPTRPDPTARRDATRRDATRRDATRRDATRRDHPLPTHPPTTTQAPVFSRLLSSVRMTRFVALAGSCVDGTRRWRLGRSPTPQGAPAPRFSAS